MKGNLNELSKMLAVCSLFLLIYNFLLSLRSFWQEPRLQHFRVSLHLRHDAFCTANGALIGTFFSSWFESLLAASFQIQCFQP